MSEKMENEMILHMAVISKKVNVYMFPVFLIYIVNTNINTVINNEISETHKYPSIHTLLLLVTISPRELMCINKIIYISKLL